MTRMVWPRTRVASVARATTRVLPSSISLRPNGGEDQPTSTWSGMTAVSGGDRKADVNSAADDRLQRLAAARGVDHLKLDAVLLEDAGLGAELGDGGVPIAALPDGELEEIVGVGAGRGGEQCGCGDCEREGG